MYDLDLTDKNYFENMEKIKGKPVPELTRDEILTRMTFLIRAERFCDGTIEEALNKWRNDRLYYVCDAEEGNP